MRLRSLFVIFFEVFMCFSSVVWWVSCISVLSVVLVVSIGLVVGLRSLIFV